MNDNCAEHISTEDSIKYLPITSQQTLNFCAQRNVDDCDLPNIFIASYPKSGTTWMQAIVYSLLSNGNEVFQHISNFSPFYEIDPHWEMTADGTGVVASKFSRFHQEIKHQVFNTHLRWSALPKGRQARFIYVLRDGKDVATSFYYHLTHQDDQGGYTGTFDQFLKEWLSGGIPFGSWAGHLREWLAAAEDPENSDSILLVRYEDMKRDLAGAVRRVARFLQCSLSESDIDSIIPKVTFEHMKANKAQYQPISVRWKNEFEFIRKGVVGDSERMFSVEQHRLFEDSVGCLNLSS